ncbi:MAG TPA: NADH-quinone oxidoreductase subunit J, partial [Bacteroidota bacterium]|nr:NADH-quinone oxidoreductase subunit J [Bacteroidota bacterium]
VPAMILAAIVFGSLAAVFYATWSHVPEPTTSATATTRTIGELLMTRFVLPFEVASVILLAALIGAAFLARRTRKP